jgi:hypothetical protein
VNPYFILAGLLALGGALGGGYWWGHGAASDACVADAAKLAGKVESAEDRRDTNVEAIATAAATAAAAALNENRGTTHESVERIRTVVVPADCRAVDPGILRELRAARDGANAALGIGVRPAGAGTDPADPR